MRAKQATSWLRSRRLKPPQSSDTGDFCHDQNEKRTPYICVRPELSAGEGLIQCSMIFDPPDQGYICLSYMWGSPVPQRAISIDGLHFRVRDNLWRFLNRARRTGITRPIWIDAICIDQANVRMRNHWVQQMGRIFSDAAEVLVWLGDDDPEIEMSLNVIDDTELSLFEKVKCELFLTRDGTVFQDSIVRDHSFLISFQEAIRKLAYLPYWDRLWIKQEILLSQKVRYLYGEAESYRLCRFLCSCDLSGRYCHAHQTMGLGRTASTKLFELRDRNAADKQIPLENLVIRFTDSVCMDVRDKVYGLLGITKGCTLTVDYTISPTELFVRTLVATSPFPDASKTKDILEFCSALVNGLKLLKNDLRRDNLDGILKRYEGTYCQEEFAKRLTVRKQETIALRLEPLAIFGKLGDLHPYNLDRRSSMFDLRYARKRLPLIPPASNSRNIRLDTRNIDDVWPKNMDVDEVTGQVLPIGTTRLKAGDVVFKLAHRHVPSSLFLIARTCRLQRDAFEVIAVAETDWSISTTFRAGDVFKRHTKLEVFSAPAAFRKIKIRHLKDEAYFIDSFQLNLGIHEMAYVSMLLDTQSSVHTWSWKKENLTALATASHVRG